jgi:hypothetical protein
VPARRPPRPPPVGNRARTDRPRRRAESTTRARSPWPAPCAAAARGVGPVAQVGRDPLHSLPGPQTDLPQPVEGVRVVVRDTEAVLATSAIVGGWSNGWSMAGTSVLSSVDGAGRHPFGGKHVGSRPADG